jgi:hypothetical protein
VQRCLGGLLVGATLLPVPVSFGGQCPLGPRSRAMWLLAASLRSCGSPARSRVREATGFTPDSARPPSPKATQANHPGEIGQGMMTIHPS